MRLLEVDAVTKTYRVGVRARKVVAVRDLSFAVDDRSGITGFVGPNGAGKTTTIKMALGLVRPSRGAIRVLGKDARAPSSRTRVAFVSEQPYFYAHLSIVESLRFAGRLRGLPGARLAEEIERVLGTVGLEGCAGKKVRELSKGMQQRLNMAQALLGEADFFIFDEPMSGMDPPGRSLFRRIFRDLEAQGKSVFFSTHILEDIETLCSRVVVLSRGRLRHDGRVEDLLAQGFEGTEMVVPRLPESTHEQLAARGCTVNRTPAGAMRIFVPADQDARAVQARLASKAVSFDSISHRRKSLETLLYDSEKGAEDA